jgi:parallel beta-helix repeat protein
MMTRTPRQRLLVVLCAAATLISFTIGVALAAHAPSRSASLARSATERAASGPGCDGANEAAPACSYERAVVADAPLAFWRLVDADGGAVVDATGNGYSGSVSQRGVAYGAGGALDGTTHMAAQFDGVDGSAVVGIDLSSTSAITVEFWLNWAAYADDDRIALEYGGPAYLGHSGFLIDPNGATWRGQFEVSLGDSNGAYNTVLFARPEAGTWHHYVLVFDRTAGLNAITPYVDGVLVPYAKPANGAGQPAPDSINFGVNPLSLMSRVGTSLFGAGALQNVSIYPAALSAAQVASHFAASGRQPASLCATSLQAIVDRTPAGGTAYAPACIYREMVTISKPLMLAAQPGAEIRGSDVWSQWTRDGGYWSHGPLPAFPTHGSCASDNQQCLWPEQVFFDGRPLQHVASNPRSGQFAVAANRSVQLADDPTNHAVEVTTRTQWIAAQSDNVTVQGWRMRHAANDAQTGALNPGGRSGWTIQDNVLSDAHGAVVEVAAGAGHRLLRNDISRGGQLGVAGGGGLIQGNHIHDNNTAGFDASWEAGGLKAAATVGGTWDGNEVDNNQGPGLWCDGRCQNITITNNRLHDNANAGILFETSNGARITGNALWENGWAFPVWGWGGGIVISTSANTEIANNVLAWNADGVTVISQDRPDGIASTGHYVHDNIIIMSELDDGSDGTGLGWLQDWNGHLLDSASNNRAEQNAFWYPRQEGSPARFIWGDGKISLSSFNATRGGENSRYVSACELDKALAAASIPLRPAHNPSVVQPDDSCQG